MAQIIRLGAANEAESSILRGWASKLLGERGYEVQLVEIENPTEALTQAKIDLIVTQADHLGEAEKQFCLWAMLKREADREVILAYDETVQLENFARTMTIGVSDLRLEAYLNRYFSHLKVRQLADRLDPNVLPLAGKEIDGWMCARSTAKRLALDHLITQKCQPHAFMPAPGQGGVVWIGRKDWETGPEIRSTFNHLNSEQTFRCEQAFAHTLHHRACSHPVFALATIVQGHLSFKGGWIRPDGLDQQIIQAEGKSEDAAKIGTEAAMRLSLGT